MFRLKRLIRTHVSVSEDKHIHVYSTYNGVFRVLEHPIRIPELDLCVKFYSTQEVQESTRVKYFKSYKDI